jgi:Protein of unknown function (DUF3302)
MAYQELLYALTFVIIYGVAFAAVWSLSELGGLPGRIARSKQHPKARAITVLGWLGLLLIVLWPLALAWAYMTPQPRTPIVERRRTATAAAADDLDALAAGQREMSEKIAALESRVAWHSPSSSPGPDLRG